ncbi:MAG: DNA topoisomerase IV subunit A [Acidothermus cellulolyticus]|nr:DNA topoisomerase IV subunit A [Acidothermus cellulolyticus]
MAAMARRTQTPPTPPPDGRVIDVDVAAEMRGSYLEYAYSVIYSRALPDARDGLKPVHRRILYQMREMGLRSDRPHVKCARVVGDVMGKLHPHGDMAIYDALVRMAQPFAMRLPLVDGHGNFGSLGGDDPPAAYRYTECRMTAAAEAMTADLDEDVVDFAPNYDGQETEPVVLPAAFPNLLVNGASGIAVGMATNMPPHNLGEVVAAARYLLENPQASLDELMRWVPGPDLPTGGEIVGLDGVREAYATGRGSFRMRATARIEEVRGRRKGIVVTELPYGVGPERVVARIKDLVSAKKLAGIADVRDLTDRHHGLRVVIEVRQGFDPQAVLDQLYKLTPLEESFAVNNVALVDGQPRTLGLADLLQVYVGHRIEVTRRRSAFRKKRREAQLHIVEGRLRAIVDIDRVIAIIRASDDTAQARDALMETFGLTEVQANDILDLPLRRLTKFSKIELEAERDELRRDIASLGDILGSEQRLRAVVSAELAAVAEQFATPRRTRLTADDGSPVTSRPLEIPDSPCCVVLSATGLLARTTGPGFPSGDADRARHDAIADAVEVTTRGDVGLITSQGRVLRLPVLDLPSLDDTGPVSLAGGLPVSEVLGLEAGEELVGLTPVSEQLDVVLATRSGVVKRVSGRMPERKPDASIIALRPGDRVVGARSVRTGRDELVLITSDAQLLHFPVAELRPQGFAAAGVAGIHLSDGASVIFFSAVDPARPAVVVTIAGASAALPGTQAGSAKVTRFSEFPGKGRGTRGVRCHRFLRGEDTLLLGWAGPAPAKAVTASGQPVELPPANGKRDGSGTPLPTPVAAVGW